MFNDIKCDIDLEKYSSRIISEVDKFFKASGIHEYIYQCKKYDDYLKSEIYKFYMIQFLTYIKKNKNRISIKEIQSNDSWIIDKVIALANLNAKRDMFEFATDGIIGNIYLPGIDDNDIFYKRLIKLFNEYSICYDIFEKAVPTYSSPHEFAKDFTNLIQLYYNFVKEQIQKNTLKTGSSNILYMLACADIYFPLVEQEINEKLKRIKFDSECPIDGIMIIKE